MMSDISNRIVAMLEGIEQQNRDYIIPNLEKDKKEIIHAFSRMYFTKDFAGVCEIFEAYLKVMSKFMQTNGDPVIERTRYDLEVLAYVADLYDFAGDEAFKLAKIDWVTLEHAKANWLTIKDIACGPIRTFYRVATEGGMLTV
jgi:hypothetical protein